MDRKKELNTLTENILAGKPIGIEAYRIIVDMPPRDVPMLMAGADRIRNAHFGSEIHLCTICNGKSGKCSEDCAFCSQSASSKTTADVYPLLNREKLMAGGEHVSETPINRYAVVTSGRGLPSHEVASVAQALGALDSDRIKTCASLGILGPEDLRVLKKAGVTRYHHNLETAKSHFANMCGTHTYEDRVKCVLNAKREGLSVCSGGIFGIGETDEQVLELALTLKDLAVDAVPLNFLTPIEGTPMAHYPKVSPLRCLKIISLFRYVLPDTSIFVCGGREASLGDHHSQIFEAGANGMMTGHYLTTDGRTLQKDLEMLDRLGLKAMEKYSG
ncbi:MAG: biotin synthase BioB [Deltaproteobacteria bacterium]|nr:biotin synthase BioB [Deltaproteobacteria bacterium]